MAKDSKFEPIAAIVMVAHAPERRRRGVVPAQAGGCCCCCCCCCLHTVGGLVGALIASKPEHEPGRWSSVGIPSFWEDEPDRPTAAVTSTSNSEAITDEAPHL